MLDYMITFIITLLVGVILWHSMTPWSMHYIDTNQMYNLFYFTLGISLFAAYRNVLKQGEQLIKTKLKTYDKEADVSKDDEKQLYVKLFLDDDNDIVMCCVDKSGNKIDGGDILFIDSRLDILVTLGGINEDIPLKTDLINEPLIYSIAEIQDLKSKEQDRRISNNINSIIHNAICTKAEKELSEKHKH